MNIKTEALENHQVKLIVEFDSDTLNSAKRKAARKIAKRTKIPGFRPGKAPYGVIVKHVGDSVVLDDAIEIIVNEQYSEIIKEADIDPYGAGSLEKIASLDPLTLEFVIPLNAEVTIGDYKKVRFPYEPHEITEEDVTEVLLSLQKQNAIVKTVDREAQKGDLVRVTLNSKSAKEEEIDKKHLFDDYQTSILIPEDSKEDEDEIPFPGFSLLLVGMKAGEEKTVQHTFDETYTVEDLRGKQLEYQINVDTVQSMELPELNDEFAQTLGDFETIEDLKAKIKENLITKETQEYQENYDQKVIEEIVSNSEFKYPPQMLDREIEDFKHNLSQRLSQQGITLDLYKKIRGMSEEEFDKEAREASEKRLKQSLAIFKIAENEKIEVDKESVNQETTQTINYLAKSLSPKEAKKIDRNRLLPNVYTNVMMDHLTRNTIEWLRKMAKGELEVVEEETEEAKEEPGEVSEPVTKEKKATRKKTSAAKSAKTVRKSSKAKEKVSENKDKENETKEA